MLNAYLLDPVIIRRPLAEATEGQNDPAAPPDLSVRGRLLERPRQAPNFAGAPAPTTHELWLPPLALDGRETIVVAGREFAIVRIESVRAFETVYLKLSLV